MDILWIILCSIVMLIGLIGAVVPALPGPPISWLGLLLLHLLKSDHPFTTRFLAIWAIIAAAVFTIDIIVPIWGTKKFGGTKYGTWGATIGLIIGIILTPIGPFFSILLGPFFGAVIGELIGGLDSKQAFKAGFGAFVGFLAGVMMKLTVSFIMFVELFRVGVFDKNAFFYL